VTSPLAADRPPGGWVVFTDLDGTLLNDQTYSYDEAAPALERCRRLGVEVVLASSKTQAEMERLSAELALKTPFVYENGGGIFFPQNLPHPPPPEAIALAPDGPWQLDLGRPYSELTLALAALKVELGLEMKGFFEMSLEEISALTGLKTQAAALAAQRQFDEPFIIPQATEAQIEGLIQAAGRLGLRVVLGGRFFHLTGPHDKGQAVVRLLAWYRGRTPEIRSIGLGDSPNDFEMLAQVDYPVLVRSGREYPALASRIPGLRVTPQPGPQGWNRAVLEILERY